MSRAYAGTVFKTQEELDKLNETVPDNKLLAAPDVVFKTVLFPQREGANFVSALYGEDAWEGVNEAYGNPPISTEQVLHPEKYFAGEEPQRTLIPNIAARLGKGWVQISSDTMGEFLLRTYLEEHLDPIQAATAAEGWGGDRYSLLTGPEGERVLLMMIAWDSFQDSAEFFDAYQVFMGIKTQGANVSSKGNETGRKWAIPDVETVFIGNTGPAILLIIGDDEDIVDLSLEQLSEALQSQAP